MKCLANTTYFLIVTGIMIIVGACDIFYFLQGKWLMFVIFMLFFILYLLSVTTNSGTLVVMNQKGIKRHFVWRRPFVIDWNQVGEWGIAGTGSFVKIEKYTGTKYIYFSMEEMTEEERFGMCLNWPPKDKIYVVFTPRRMRYVMQNLGKKPVCYHVKETDIFR